MRILIISDTHGHDDFFPLLKLHDCQIMLHAGDSQLSYDQFKNLPIVIVKGNCDMDMRFSDEEVYASQNHQYFIAHGDMLNANYSNEEVALQAKACGCDIAIYGHTHIVDVSRVHGVLCINPGSYARSLCAYPNSYMVFDEEQDLLIMYDTKHNELASWQVSSINETNL